MNFIIEQLVENQKKIADLIGTFKEAMNKKQCKEEVLDLLHRVSYYTEDFFVKEDLLLKSVQLPTFQKHNEEHRLFVDKMKEFHGRLETDDPDICLDVLNYMENWYKSYMMNSDKQIIEYIEKNKAN
ncbi:MAG: hemerythrin family protein [Bacteroidales bacterium]